MPQTAQPPRIGPFRWALIITGSLLWLSRPRTEVSIYHRYCDSRYDPETHKYYSIPVCRIYRSKPLGIFSREMKVTAMSPEDALSFALDQGFGETLGFWRSLYGYKGLPKDYRGTVDWRDREPPF